MLSRRYRGDAYLKITQGSNQFYLYNKHVKFYYL